MNAHEYRVDPYWPRPLPERWITGQLGGVAVDPAGRVVVVNRRDITAEEAETGEQAPPVLVFDAEGELVDAWGDPDVVPRSIHGVTIDHDGAIWVGGNQDAVIQKYSPDGRLLLQIGERGVFDSVDGTAATRGRNESATLLYQPANAAIDPATGEVFVADGYGNRRIAVFDRDGRFLRQWGRQAETGEAAAGVAGAFSEVVHCVAISREGLVYVCDRQGDRIQVFDRGGAFVRNIWIRTGTDALPDPRGTAWWVAFSPDREQRHLYVMDGRGERVLVLDHADGAIVGGFGRPGHQLGQFTHGHTLAVDAERRVYVAETSWGRRIQRFSPVRPGDRTV